MPKKGDVVKAFVESLEDLSRCPGYNVLRLAIRPDAPVLIPATEPPIQEGNFYYVEITGRIPRNPYNPNHSAGYFGKLICGV